jgi:hypothetical protein
MAIPLEVLLHVREAILYAEPTFLRGAVVEKAVASTVFEKG